MSSGGGAYGRTERVRHSPYYDQVPEGVALRASSFDPLPSLSNHRDPRLAQSADPLPPPPLPHHPPVGPEFDASGGEGDSDVDQDAALDIKPVHRFIPDSWKDFFRGSERSSKGAWSKLGSSVNNNSSSKGVGSQPASSVNNNNNSSTTEGVRCSPPHSPSLPRSYGGSYNSRKELLEATPTVSGHTHRTALSYGERVEEYHQRYGYMKSWAGLLRILGCVELLLGAAVFACVCAYVHKDNEWFNMFGYSSPGGAYGAGFYGAGTGGAYYTGPKTPFVLVVAGLAWLVTVILLVLGMTLYYRSILLDANWWPLTEFIINLCLAVLYMAAGIVYVRDTTRGGLCSYPVFNNGINGAFCRTEAGQTAAIIFLFVTMVLYLISAIVCLKLWRHEATRRERERYAREVQMQPSEMRALHSLTLPDSAHQPKALEERGSSVAPIRAPPTKVLQGPIPLGHTPKPVIVPDYIAKYPPISSDEGRDQYRAVFNDQYSEYKELHSDVQITIRRFEEMDLMMQSLPQHPGSHMEVERINKILQEYQRKKNDPTFVEKKERCEYLKCKLSHIKQKIQEYDKVMEWNDGFS